MTINTFMPELKLLALKLREIRREKDVNWEEHQTLSKAADLAEFVASQVPFAYMAKKKNSDIKFIGDTVEEAQRVCGPGHPDYTVFPIFTIPPVEGYDIP